MPAEPEPESRSDAENAPHSSAASTADTENIAGERLDGGTAGPTPRWTDGGGDMVGFCIFCLCLFPFPVGCICVCGCKDER